MAQAVSATSLSKEEAKDAPPSISTSIGADGKIFLPKEEIEPKAWGQIEGML
jgi:hypothetical protein